SSPSLAASLGFRCFGAIRALAELREIEQRYAELARDHERAEPRHADFASERHDLFPRGLAVRKELVEGDRRVQARATDRDPARSACAGFAAERLRQAQHAQ